MSLKKAGKKQADPGSARGSAAPKRTKSRWREHVESLGSAILLFLIVRTFLIQAFRIPSESMEDTLLKGDFLFVNKFLYGAKLPFVNTRLPEIRDPRRGDVIVFKNPTDRKTDYIKRCVAVSGDTVAVRSNVLYVNGEPQDDSYIKLNGIASPLAANWPAYVCRNCQYAGNRRNQSVQGLRCVRCGSGGLVAQSFYVVPDDHFFAMGDNRNNSSDSRFFTDRGAPEPAVPRDLIVGKALFIYCSLDPERHYLVPRFNRMFRAVK